MTSRVLLTLSAVLLAVSCSREDRAVDVPATAQRPSILLVTLDTTRADAIGPDAKGLDTPGFNAVAARGLRFRHAYATVPQTLPSHSSMLTGLYPAAHGVHENARPLASSHPVAAEALKAAGYRTGAFVSAVPLARQFGLGRGFDRYDDALPAGRSERSARETTDRALGWLQESAAGPTFLWVHFFEPHAPYEPPAEFARRYTDQPYLGEVAAMDEQLARLIAGFQSRPGSHAVIVAADHGEGLGEHGESQHGYLLYQSTMRVPLVVAGPGVRPAVIEEPVSTRRIYHTILDFAGLGREHSLRGRSDEVVIGESMIPFLDFGWQPQVMTVERTLKTIRAGKLEVYDVAADPMEQRNLAQNAQLSRPMRAALRDYPLPSLKAATAPSALSEEDRKQLAALGYVGSDAAPVIRPDAPRPRDMVHLFDDLERASSLFVEERFAESVPVLSKIVAADPHNLMSVLRLAAAQSVLGREAEAEREFERAAALAPDSPDVRTYLALHYARGRQWARAVPMLERIVAESPDRVPALDALATLRLRQKRPADALALRLRVAALRTPMPRELTAIGLLAMETGQTGIAIDQLERARRLAPAEFRHQLELGVLLLAARRYPEARDALDRVPTSHPGYPMAAFKRAQVSVLLNEPDRADRIATARRVADRTTGPLIERERLFR